MEADDVSLLWGGPRSKREAQTQACVTAAIGHPRFLILPPTGSWVTAAFVKASETLQYELDSMSSQLGTLGPKDLPGHTAVTSTPPLEPRPPEGLLSAPGLMFLFLGSCSRRRLFWL